MFEDYGLGHVNNVARMADHAQYMQGQAAERNAQATMNAIQRENERRVAISREQRRMEHEKEMQQMQIDALLARLQQAAPQDRNTVRFEGGAIRLG